MCKTQNLIEQLQQKVYDLQSKIQQQQKEIEQLNFMIATTKAIQTR